jgi:hypothetical protein
VPPARDPSNAANTEPVPLYPTHYSSRTLDTINHISTILLLLLYIHIIIFKTDVVHFYGYVHEILTALSVGIGVNNRETVT